MELIKDKRVIKDYYVDEDGNVYNSRGRILKGRAESSGYLQVRLPVAPNTFINFTVHNLVAEAFLGKRPQGYDVDHIDFDRTNNRVDNLRYLDLHINRGRKKHTVERHGNGFGLAEGQNKVLPLPSDGRKT